MLRHRQGLGGLTGLPVSGEGHLGGAKRIVSRWPAGGAGAVRRRVKKTKQKILTLTAQIDAIALLQHSVTAQQVFLREHNNVVDLFDRIALQTNRKRSARGQERGLRPFGKLAPKPRELA